MASKQANERTSDHTIVIQELCDLTYKDDRTEKRLESHVKRHTTCTFLIEMDTAFF